MNSPASHASTEPFQGTRTYAADGWLGLSPVVAGTVCCAVSALGYAAAQVCLRQLSGLDADPMWVICNKELVTVVVVGPWLFCQVLRGTPVLPRRPAGTRLLGLLLLVGLANQLGGNLGLQWALGVVGLAVSTPVVFGAMLTASALLGLAFLGERVSQRSILAIALLLAALVLLGAAAYATHPSGAVGGGAGQHAGSELAGGSLTLDPSHPAVPARGSLTLDPSHPAWGPRRSGSVLLALGIGATCLAGAVYAVLTTTIRHAVTSAVPIGTIVFITTLMGVVSLGPSSAYRLGTAHLLATPPEQIVWMAAAGTLNLIAFLALTKGLQLTTVVHANVLGASQVAMAALAGTLIFAEPKTTWLLAGVGLTILGVVLIDPPEVKNETPVTKHE